jgi:hypothetical protein
MKNTLTSQHGDYIRPLIQPGNLNYKSLLKTIHTESVSTFIQSQDNNPVLDEPPPPINKSESTLPRRTRSLLSQLRSGYSSILNSYLYRIREDVTDECPDCQMQPHTTKHLFNCPENPASLTVRDLWNNPTDVARFLK